MNGAGSGRDRRPHGCPDARTDQGSTTIYAVAGMALLSAMALVVIFLTGALTSKHRAGSAADLAALAAAGAMRASVDPCAAAADIARRNGASLTACSVAGSSVTVEVRAPAPALLGIELEVSGAARAGWSPPPS